jgi:hypothetical protein
MPSVRPNEDRVHPVRSAPAVVLRESVEDPGAARAVESLPTRTAPALASLAPAPTKVPPVVIQRTARTPGPLTVDLRLPPSYLPAAVSRRSIVGAPIAAADLYSNRFGPRKVAALDRFGGTAETERAVAMGLRYLAGIQHRRGHWGDSRHEHDKYGEVWVGKTGLCVLAFLGAGHTHRSGTEYSDHLRRAIEALLQSQDGDTGHFGSTSAYSHGITTYALAECLAITRDDSLRAPLERAVRWIVRHQNRGRDPRSRGGWGYFSATLEPEDRFARTSVSAWQIMALESAKLSGLAIEDAVLDSAATYLNAMFDEQQGYYLYNREPDRLRSSWRTLPASTPAAVFCLLLLGHEASDYRLRAGLEYTVERRPRRYRSASDDAFVRRGEGNVYFWYYGSLACFLAGGDVWEDWNRALKEVLPAAQNPDGSWTPVGAYSRYADEAADDMSYTTAMIVLSLEVYYRYFTPLLEKE